MSFVIGTCTVVDDSRNVCVNCVNACCITASSQLQAPSGNTAGRPVSPAAGDIYFDTDEGSLMSYNGVEWAKAGGSTGVSYTKAVPYSCDVWTITAISNEDGIQCRGVQCACLKVDNANQGSKTYWHNSGFFGECADVTGNASIVQCVECFSCVYSIKAKCQFCVCQYPVYFSTNLGIDCCYTRGVVVFNDGSLCGLTAYCCDEGNCRNKVRYNTAIISKTGEVGVSDQWYNNQNFNCLYACTQITPEDRPYLHYQGIGVCGPVTGTGFACEECWFKWEFLRKLEYNGCYCVWENSGSSWNPYLFEIDQSTFGQNGFKVCCFTPHRRNNTNLSWGSIRTVSPAVCLCCGLTHYPAATLQCFYCVFSNILGPYALDCCVQNKPYFEYTFISKNPCFSNIDPTYYTKTVSCNSATGVLEKSLGSHAYYCSIGYRRMLVMGTPCCCACPMCLTGFNFISKDGCYLYHLYGPEVCLCNTNNFCSNAQTVTYQDACAPALEKIDLTTGCFVCSVYYTDLCDCTNGSTTYLHCASATSLTVGMRSLMYCHDVGLIAASNPAQRQYQSNNKGRTLHERDCVVESCIDPNKTYFVSLGSNTLRRDALQIAEFNESTLNFDKIIHNSMSLNCCIQLMNFINMAWKGCCSTCAIFSCMCTKLLDYAATTGQTDCKGGFFETIFGMCPNSFAGQCSCCSPYLTNLGFCCCDIQQLPGYINPTNNHLVCFMALMSCCFTECCYLWIGAVCIDLDNGLCISAVDTMWPTSYDKCTYMLTRGLACGACNNCYFNYACRPTGLNMPHYLSFQRGYELPLMFKTYATPDESEAGVVIRLGSCFWKEGIRGLGLTLSSSCQLCPACPGGGGYCGWFGPCCYGTQVVNNTNCGTNCGTGLKCAAQTFNAFSRVPYCKPLCDSGFFERSACDKVFLEILLGCHCLGIWARALLNFNCDYSAAETCLDCIRHRCQFTPSYLTKCDITCQYTLNCTGVYTWNWSMFCSKCRWKIWDVGNDNICAAFCNIPVCCWNGTAFACCALTINLCGLLCDIFECDIGHCACYKCCQAIVCGCNECYLWCAKHYANWTPSNHPIYNMTILDNITDAVFGNCEYHSDYLQFSRRNYTPVETFNTYSCEYNNCAPCKTSYNIDIMWKWDENTGKGASGPIVQWFNTAYACVC